MKKVITIAGINTITLDFPEGDAFGYVWVRNVGENSVGVSTEENGTYSDVASREGVRVPRTEKLYVDGASTVEIYAETDAECPFKSAAKGGEGGAKSPDELLTISASGNPIVFTDLQPDVPFAKITLTGANGEGADEKLTPSSTSSNYCIADDGTVKDTAMSSIPSKVMTFPVTAGERYYVRSLTSRTNKYCFYSSTYTSSAIMPVGTTTGVVTVPSGANYIRVVGAGSADEESGLYTVGEKNVKLTANGTDYSLKADSYVYEVPYRIPQIAGENTISCDDANVVISVTANKLSQQLGAIYGDMRGGGTGGVDEAYVIGKMTQAVNTSKAYTDGKCGDGLKLAIVDTLPLTGEEDTIYVYNPAEGPLHYGRTNSWIYRGKWQRMSDYPTDLADISDDADHRTVTDAEKTAWNGKTKVEVSTFAGTTSSSNGHIGLVVKPSICDVIGVAFDNHTLYGNPFENTNADVWGAVLKSATTGQAVASGTAYSGRVYFIRK